ncbi:hypothetical protein DW1_0941 [Proteiniborus sp. DW1]|uniref:LapA family protein n=1 Tax=Proteiniborus sp. DW1 TaxID=1889883 RepID=UPI00092E04F4|nr:LapA family protein [Proteiniborus sp. DW1]SCG82548.1 hypothetical protein DW1_0941 [Proteiniborus sp. DW1]
MKLKINMEIRFIISLLFSIIVAVFAIQNAGNVEINFLFAKFTISQAIVILASAIVGALIVLLLGLIKQIKQNMKIKQLNKEIESIIEERDKLQTRVDELTSGSIQNEETVEETIKELDLDDVNYTEFKNNSSNE